jgi:hypothetical protein
MTKATLHLWGAPATHFTDGSGRADDDSSDTMNKR